MQKNAGLSSMYQEPRKELGSGERGGEGREKGRGGCPGTLVFSFGSRLAASGIGLV